MPDHEPPTLPPELINEILASLNSDDDLSSLKSCSLVCHSWEPQSRAYVFNRIWIIGPLAEAFSVNWNQLFEMLRSSPNKVSAYIRELHLVVSDEDAYYEVRDGRLQGLPKPSVHPLPIHDANSLLPSLTRVAVSPGGRCWDRFFVGSEPMQNALASLLQCPRIAQVNLVRGTIPSRLLQTCRSLTTLSLFDMSFWPTTAAHLSATHPRYLHQLRRQSLPQQMPSLAVEVLEISRYHDRHHLNFTFAELKSKLTPINFMSVKTLRLAVNFQIYEKGLDDFLRDSVPNVEDLDLWLADGPLYRVNISSLLYLRSLVLDAYLGVTTLDVIAWMHDVLKMSTRSSSRMPLETLTFQFQLGPQVELDVTTLFAFLSLESVRQGRLNMLKRVQVNIRAPEDCSIIDFLKQVKVPERPELVVVSVHRYSEEES